MIQFPARTIVVDDQVEEATPLISALRQEGTPCLYYSGRHDDLPLTPLQGIRVLFLDLRLAGMEGQPIKMVVAALMGVVKRVVSEHNGPYVILAWTKHPDDLDDVREALSTLTAKPLIIVPMIKAECRVQPAGEYNLQLVREKLAEKMAELGAAGLLLRWEELVRQAAGNVLNEICCLPGSTPLQVAAIFSKLARASVGKAIEGLDGGAVAREALFAMSGMLDDSLERAICADETITLDLSEKSAPGIDDEDINAKLLMSPNVTPSQRPGMMFSWRDPDPCPLQIRMVESSMQPDAWKDAHELLAAMPATPEPTAEVTKADSKAVKIAQRKKAAYDAFQALTETRTLFTVIVTPYCDYSQKKALRPKTCLGLFWPTRYFSYLQPKAEFLYVTPAVKLATPYDDKFHLIIDLRTVAGADEQLLNEPMLALRRELVLDIQNQLARQMSRPGTTAIT
jgi:hypothetical protein